MPQGYGYRQIWVWVDPKIPMGYLCRTLDVLTKALPSVKAKHFASALVLSTGMVWGGVLKIFKLCANSILIYILSVYDLILSWYFPFITFFPLFIISCTTMVSLGIHYLVWFVTWLLVYLFVYASGILYLRLFNTWGWGSLLRMACMSPPFFFFSQLVSPMPHI